MTYAQALKALVAKHLNSEFAARTSPDAAIRELSVQYTCNMIGLSDEELEFLRECYQLLQKSRLGEEYTGAVVEPISMADVEALRAEALASGEQTITRVCDVALTGWDRGDKVSARARELVYNLIVDARKLDGSDKVL